MLKYDIDYASIRERTANGNVNRVHVAMELIEKGYVSSLKEALEGILKDGAGFYNAPKKINFFDAIEFLKEINALPVLAHPLKELTPSELSELLPEAKEKGLCDIKTMHSDYSNEMLITAEKTAKENALLESGGSDFHGANKPHINLGTGKGNLCIPLSFYKNLFDIYISQKQ